VGEQPGWRRSLGREHAARKVKRLASAMADWDWVLRQARSRLRAGVERSDGPVTVLSCKIVITGTRGNSNLLTVRCRCMAGTRDDPAELFYAYDPLGTAVDLPEALRIWREHAHGRADV
jgi:hypothetical protein